MLFEFIEKGSVLFILKISCQNIYCTKSCMNDILAERIGNFHRNIVKPINPGKVEHFISLNEICPSDKSR